MRVGGLSTTQNSFLVFVHLIQEPKWSLQNLFEKCSMFSLHTLKLPLDHERLIRKSLHVLVKPMPKDGALLHSLIFI